MSKKSDSSNHPMGFIEQLVGRLVEKFLPRNNFIVFVPGELTKLWEEIEGMEPKMAIIEADKVVDVVLKKAGVPGETMAERLRKVQKHVQRSIYSGMWDAHKVRNQLVHEVGRNDSYAHVETIWKMKKFLISLGSFKND
jgi:hypothetical protein